VGTSYETKLYAQGPATSQNLEGLTIRVIAGEGSVNIIKKKTAVKPVVEVRDKNNLPVAGASVVFLAPGSGASATFAGGARTVTVVTNSAGRAAVSTIQPVGEGSFKIGVSASFNSQIGTASIAQTNFLTAAAAQAAGVGGAAAGSTAAGTGAATAGAAGAGAAGTGISLATVGIIAGAAAAATTAAVVVTKKKSPTTITAGSTVIHFRD
jgi:hypothetical protein